MKRTKILLIITAMILTITLNASVRINALGSYFEYLISDTETDIELFPSHLSELDGRYIQIINNGYLKNYEEFNARNINFSIMPFSSKLSFKINADIASNSYEPRIYLKNNYRTRTARFEGSEFGSALISNSLSYKFTDSFNLGCFVDYGVNWKEISYESLEMEDPDVVLHDESFDSEYSNDFLSAGINFRFGSSNLTDISLIYSIADIEDLDMREIDFERIYPESETIRRSIDEDVENFETEAEDIGISILLETTNINVVNRYFMESHYIKQITEFSDEDFSEDSRHEDGELTFYRKRDSENISKGDMSLYNATLGFGKTVNKNEFEIFYGVKLFGMYAETERDDSYNYLELYQDIDPDTTYSDTTSISGETIFKIIDWKAAIEIPFGVSYKLNKTFKFNGGIGIKLIRQELEYFEDNEFSRWETDRYVAIGSTISPLECLKCDINFGYDFASFGGWQIDLKYLW